MLDVLCGNKSVAKILLFLFVNGKCYGGQLQKIWSIALTPIQKALVKLEKAGIVVSYYEGKTRLYQFNEAYPLRGELEQLLKKSYTMLSSIEKKEYYVLNRENRITTSVSTLLAFWQRLSSVTSLSFESREKSQEETGRTGKGKGLVLVIKEQDNVLIFQEKGTWQGTIGGELTFTNAFRWTLDRSAKVISLEHLRRGIDHPVFLFHLAPTSDKTLSSIDSHFCELDVYMGHIQFYPHSFRLSWRIIGPKKNEEIEYLYT